MMRPDEPVTGDEVGVDDEWPATFAQVPDWITLHPELKAQSVREYAFLMAHVPTDGRRRVAFPGQASIARVLQLGRSDKVTPYTRALVNVGAVRIEEIRTPKGRAYRYVLRFNPPPGYGGPKCLADFYGTPKDQLDNQWAGFSMATAPVANKGEGSPQKEGDPSPQKEGDPYPQKEGPKKTNRNQTNLKNKDAVADAVGKSAGGCARADESDSAAEESGQAEGGSAASGTTLPTQRTQSPRPATTKTRPRKESPGFDLVRVAIPAAVASPGTKLFPGLHRAINDLLDGNAGAGIPGRTPEQVIARINRRWFGENADTRSAADYRGCDRCTASGCDAARGGLEDPEGCDRIKNRNSWLAAALLAQDCPDPRCEDGQLIEGGDCSTCRERATERREAARAGAAAEARWEAHNEAQRALTAAQVAAAAWAETEAAEQRRFRQILGESGVYGQLLDHRVGQHMTGWRDRNPRPTGRSAAPGSLNGKAVNA
ncbi:hypothetical protein ACFRFL_13900 [Streptomyces sp. NPDC056708]|uniref:hypothetical protein n=1 Tax=unclassified Streptomyces TaxID=2593676 RepID=UPI0036B444D9